MKLKSEEGKILKLKKEVGGGKDPEAQGVRGGGPGGTFTYHGSHGEGGPAGREEDEEGAGQEVGDDDEGADRLCQGNGHTSLPDQEPLLAMHPKSFQYSYRQDIRIRNTRLAYLDALIDQQEKFGYAVDESEAEVTDDEDEFEDDDGTVVNLLIIKGSSNRKAGVNNNFF